MSDLSKQLGIVTSRQPGGRVVIRLAGILDGAGRTRVIEESAQVDLQAGDHVVVRLNDVTYLDSSGVGALYYLRALARVRGCSLELVAPHHQIRGVLESDELARDLCALDSPAQTTPDHRIRRRGRGARQRGAPRCNDGINRSRAEDHDPSGSTLVVTRTDAADRVRLRATGEIDLASLPVLVNQLRRAITNGDGLILVDLADVTYMDVCGVNALVAAHRSAPTRVRLGPLHPAV